MKKVIAMMLCVCMLVCGLAGTVQAAAYSDWKDLSDNSGNWMYYEWGVVIDEFRGYTSVNTNTGYEAFVEVQAVYYNNIYAIQYGQSGTSRYTEVSLVETNLAKKVHEAKFIHEVYNSNGVGVAIKTNVISTLDYWD